MAYELGYEVKLVEMESGIEFENRGKWNGCRVRAEEWRNMMHELGYEVKLVDRKSGIEFEGRRKGHGRRVRQVINGVLYDTYKADMLCGDFFKYGASEYTDGMAFELYVDYFGRFFVARYTDWENGSDSITTIGKEEAGKLYKKYGDGTLKDSIFI